ncbi:sortase-dependent protein [Streptomyces sp. NPDC004838]
MSPRLTLRSLAVASLAIGAVLVPGTAASADEKPKPKPSPSVVPLGDCRISPETKGDGEKIKLCTGTKWGGVVPRGVVPRGGVAAGERPAAEENGGTATATTTAIAGTAAATLLAAGGYVLIGRRNAARGNG